MNCPLGVSGIPPCQRCMYSAKDGACLYSAQLSVEDFAKRKGVSSVHVEKAIESAAAKITAGITLAAYLEWFKQSGLSLEVASKEAIELVSNSPYYKPLGLTADHLQTLAQDKVWAKFKSSMGEVQLPLHEALLLSEWQYEELSQSTVED